MDSYGFFTGDGNELNRGYQCTEEQAREQCRALAMQLGAYVEAIVEPCRYDYAKDEPAPSFCAHDADGDETDSAR